MAKKKRKKFQIILTFEILIVLALAVFAFFLVKVNKIERETVDEKKVNAKDIKGFTNIMLFGVDARGKELKNSTRSDTMILVSINEKTKEITLTSFYRDYYAFSPAKAKSDKPVKLDSSEFDKLTHAYNNGAEAALKEINTNFDLDVTDFVTVNFIALVRVIDELGGVELDVPQKLVSEINKYGGEIARKHKEPFTKVTKGGVQTLTGYQALGYCRTRHKDGDFYRSQRQREVINKVFKKFKQGANITKANALYDAVAANMTTSFSTKKIISLLSDAPQYKIREEINASLGNGFPYHPIEYRPNGISCQISQTPKDDIIMLHYNLFNNGVLPEQYTSTSDPNSQNSTSSPESSETSSSENKGLDYNYTPSPTVDLITRYHQSCYNNLSNK